MRIVFLLLVFATLSFACEGEISQYVPAVIGTDGGLINVSVELIPGNGNVYSTVYPTTGLMTQQSIIEAVSYAYLLSGKQTRCSILFTFGHDYPTSYIEGPSGGAAFTVMAYALLENKTMRNDTIITGSIDGGGNVGAVGGVYEKVKGAAAKGATYFIAPQGNLYETLLLKNLEDKITVLEVDRIEDVIGFMMDNETIVQEPFSAKKREIPELPAYDTSKLEAFIPIAEKMVYFEEEVLVSISVEDNETTAIKEFFENEIQRQESLMDDGYVFSAANEAFLNYMDISTVAAIIKGKADLSRKKGEIGICLTGITRPNVTNENFEWVVGSDLRQAWAYDRWNKTNTLDDLLTDEEFVVYHELLYAKAWCNVAKELTAAAPEGGNAINESSWEGLAEDKIAEASEVGITALDTQNRLAIAEKSYEQGNYGAAIFDAVYVIAMEEADAEILSGEMDDIEPLLEEEYDSLWGEIYHSHAVFLYEMNEYDAAYRTIKFAKGLEQATEEMKAELVVEKTEEESVDVVFLAGVVVLLFLFIIIVLIMRTYGNQRKGYRKPNRAKQKKGRV
ncbi:hypothetical protein KKB44_03325 [Candidatus Micrarchaeota archaeon]|nr:hypothetical protein [Candidatus Micrarchaeota archaeon]